MEKKVTLTLNTDDNWDEDSMESSTIGYITGATIDRAREIEEEVSSKLIDMAVSDKPVLTSNVNKVIFDEIMKHFSSADPSEQATMIIILVRSWEERINRLVSRAMGRTSPMHNLIDALKKSGATIHTADSVEDFLDMLALDSAEPKGEA